MANWQSFVYSVQGEARDYIVAVLGESTADIECRVTSGETMVNVGSGKCGMLITNGRCSLSVGAGNVQVKTER